MTLHLVTAPAHLCDISKPSSVTILALETNICSFPEIQVVIVVTLKLGVRRLLIPLGIRFKQNCKINKFIKVGDHCIAATRQSVSMDNLKVLDRKQDKTMHNVKEGIHIK